MLRAPLASSLVVPADNVTGNVNVMLHQPVSIPMRNHHERRLPTSSTNTSPCVRTSAMVGSINCVSTSHQHTPAQGRRLRSVWHTHLHVESPGGDVSIEVGLHVRSEKLLRQPHVHRVI